MSFSDFPNYNSSDSVVQNVILYLPAVIKEYKAGWRIEYWCFNPQKKQLVRQQIRIGSIVARFKTKKEARLYLSPILGSINTRLASGWNPFFEEKDSRLNAPLTAVLNEFLQEKEKELRTNTMRSYRSFVMILTTWMEKKHLSIVTGRFNRVLAISYMDYIYKERNVSARTYNNQLKMARCAFNWLQEKCYITENPFEHIKTKAKQQKKRILIPPDVRQQIIEHLQKKQSNFLIVCELVYSSLIRPKEIKLIKLEHIHLDEHYIEIPGTNAKNHHTRISALSPELEIRLRALKLDTYPKSYYLFGTSLTPSAQHCGDVRFSKEWIKIRNELNLPKEMQLYGLRDSGINNMLKSGIDNLTVMQHAGHSSLDMTAIYANHVDPKLIETIYERAPKF